MYTDGIITNPRSYGNKSPAYSIYILNSENIIYLCYI